METLFPKAQPLVPTPSPGFKAIAVMDLRGLFADVAWKSPWDQASGSTPPPGPSFP